MLHINDQFLLISDRFCRRALSILWSLAGPNVACGETISFAEMSSQLSATGVADTSGDLVNGAGTGRELMKCVQGAPPVEVL